MSGSVRRVLAESHVAAVAIAVLVVWSLDLGVRALARPVFGLSDFVINVIAIRAIPYGSGTFYWGPWITPLTYAFSGIIYFIAASILSRGVFGTGPFRSLRECCAKLARRNYA